MTRHIARLASALALLAALALAPEPAAAQEPGRAASADRWQITLEGDQYVWDIRLMGLRGDSVVVGQADSTFAVALAGMTELRRIRKTDTRLGGDRGGAMAALMGTDDEVYDLRTLDTAGKRRIFEQVLSEKPADQR